jgi:cbb3-type cytochrome oxidase maturation protein
MSALLFLIPAALALGFLGLMAFIWSAKNGQYDDLEGAANRILFDDEAPKISKEATEEDKNPYFEPADSEDK